MGGKNYVSINTTELQIADPCLDFEVTKLLPYHVAVYYLKMQAYCSGILLRVGEHLVVTNEHVNVK